MALDIFSSFDDHHKVMGGVNLLLWFIPPFVLISTMKPNHVGFMMIKSPRYIAMSTAHKLLKLTNVTKIGGGYGFLTSLMMVIVFLNISGLFPYFFSLTSHMAINFPLAITLWLTVTLLSLSYSPIDHLAHCSPMGTPMMLSPILAVIELVSNLVRPVTLSVRLTANLSTGHVLFNLMGDSFAHAPMYIEFLTIIMGLAYMSFELGVCGVQMYIFALLSSLYADEHPNKENLINNS